MLRNKKDAGEDLGENYRRHWGTESKTNTDFDPTQRKRRSEKAQETSKDYYELTTDNYENGWSENFHFCRFPLPLHLGETFQGSQWRHNDYLALMMSLRPGMRVLDVGCGIGGPAREIARFADCNVVGITISPYQVKHAEKYTAEDGFPDGQLEFVEGDFTKMPFEDNSFDAAFAVEATVHAPTLDLVYREIFRVLKPGAVFGSYEQVMTERFDEADPSHREVRGAIERGTGITNLCTYKQSQSALEACGFKIERQEDLAQRKDPVPWWSPLDGQLGGCRCVADFYRKLRLTPAHRFLMYCLVSILELFGLVKKGKKQAMITMTYAINGYRDGGKMGIFTPMALFVSHKPR